MSIIIHKNRYVLCLIMLTGTTLHSFAPLNFFAPYNAALNIPSMSKKTHFRLGVNTEYGSGKKGRNHASNKSNILQLYENSQSTIGMLDLPLPALMNNGTFFNTAVALRAAGAADDGTRGHFQLNGNFTGWDVTPHLSYKLEQKLIPGEITFQLAVPVRYARVNSISFNDLTSKDAQLQNRTTVNLLTKSFDTLKTFVKETGNLDLSEWSDTALGDTSLMVWWSQNYPQNQNDDLKNVELRIKAGLSFPTGLKKDQDKAFSLALGNDGAWAIPIGLAIDLDFSYNLAFGLEAEFNILFDRSATYRMKTSQNQTEFLLLNKGEATKDHGLTWKFYMYGQAFRFWKGISLKTAYEYTKHDNDHLSPKSNDFSVVLVNTATSLAEWNTHNVIFSINYDSIHTKCPLKPQLSLFYKLPVAGRNAICHDTIGGQLTFNF